MCNTCSFPWQHTLNLFLVWVFCSLKNTLRHNKNQADLSAAIRRLYSGHISCFLCLSCNETLASNQLHYHIPAGTFQKNIDTFNHFFLNYVSTIILTAWLQTIYPDKIANDPDCSICGDILNYQLITITVCIWVLSKGTKHTSTWVSKVRFIE